VTRAALLLLAATPAFADPAALAQGTMAAMACRERAATGERELAECGTVFATACADAGGAAADCAEAQAGYWEEIAEVEYRAALARARAGERSAEAAGAVAGSQLAWTAWRDAECGLHAALGGPTAAADCRARLAFERVEALVSFGEFLK